MLNVQRDCCRDRAGERRTNLFAIAQLILHGSGGESIMFMLLV